MNALLTSNGRRFLPLIAIGSILSGLPSSTRADMLNSRPTIRAAFAVTNLSPHGFSSRFRYESQGESRPQLHNRERSRPSALAALALISIIPAGTLPVFTDGSSAPPSPPPPPPPPPPTTTTTTTTTTSTPSTPGGGTIASTPEPAALVLALSGCGTALFGLLRRRRSHN